jgi:signal transduction histidine kinase
VLGTVLVDYPLDALRQHFVSLFRASLAYSVFLLIVLLLVGSLLGRQLVRPITRLRECMRSAGKGDLNVQCKVIKSNDELGELARGFEDMLAGLREKQLLEKEIMKSEHLAALGQVASGVAHEINNPLGGMLNAINTFKRHGHEQGVAEHALDLLERGLQQIQTSVQALLVQSRIEGRALSQEDIDDIRTLISSEVNNKSIRLEWHCEPLRRLAISSTAVRHIMMNLLLNAIQAVDHGGHIKLDCERRADALVISVTDNGPGIPEDRKQRMFEPFCSFNGGNGLGLWIIQQTVSQLDGKIEVFDLSPGTRIKVRLPLAQQNETASPAIGTEITP